MKIFILIDNCGEGFYKIRYCLKQSILDKIENLVYEKNFPQEDFPGFDEDGFSYKTIEIPDGCTIESIGISEDDLITDETINTIQSTHEEILRIEKEKNDTLTRLAILNRKLLFDKATEEDKIELRKVRDKAVANSWTIGFNL